MDKIKLKRLMTDVAKGKISEKDAQDLINGKKVHQDKPNKQKKGKDTHKRKKSIKSGR